MTDASWPSNEIGGAKLAQDPDEARSEKRHRIAQKAFGAVSLAIGFMLALMVAFMLFFTGRAFYELSLIHI